MIKTRIKRKTQRFLCKCGLHRDTSVTACGSIYCFGCGNSIGTKEDDE